MNLTKLIISPESLGQNLLLVDVAPAYDYKDGKRTSTITGYRYTVAMPSHGFDKISVRINGKQQLDAPEDYAEVTFEGLELHLYWTPNGHQLAARAKAVKLVGDSKSVKV